MGLLASRLFCLNYLDNSNNLHTFAYYKSLIDLIGSKSPVL